MNFSVVIPTCHRNDLLALCLDRLAPGRQEEISKSDPFSYEVIVTDDGAQSTAEQLIKDRYSWARWVAGPRKGPAANRNNGARLAGGEWLVFVDDDCLPEATFFLAYADAIRSQSQVAVFEGRTYAGRPRRTLAESSPVNETGGYLWSCNFAIQRKLFVALGGFDERFPYAAMEDVDFRVRLKRAGEKFAFVPGAAVCHPWRRDNIGRELARHEESVAIFLRLHPEHRSEFGTRSELMIALRGFIKETIPGLWQYRGAGLTHALQRNLFHLVAAFRKFPRENGRASRENG